MARITNDPHLVPGEDDWEGREKAFRLFGRQEDESTLRDRIITITTRNRDRPGKIQGTRTGSWGKNVRCRDCDELVHSNNYRGREAMSEALIRSGEHLYEKHFDRLDRRVDRQYVVTVSGCTKAEAEMVMRERLLPKEDYGFDYLLAYEDRP